LVAAARRPRRRDLLLERLVADVQARVPPTITDAKPTATRLIDAQPVFRAIVAAAR
jgi:hypothetical protein